MPEEPTVSGDLDAEGQQLLQMAEEYDKTGVEPEAPVETAPETPKTAEYNPPEPPEPKETEPELKPAAERGRDDKGRFKPAEAKEGEVAKPVEVTPKDESEYRKAQRDLERRQKTWRETEEEKREARELRAQVEAERKALEVEKARQQMANMPRAQKDGFTAPDYAKAAEDFAKEGDYENAFRAFQTERELIAYEQEWYAQNSQKQQQMVLDADFRASLEEGIKGEPDWNNNGSPIRAAVDQILAEYPGVYYLPGGGKAAVRIGRMALDQQELVKAKAEIEELKAQLGDRERKSQPLRSGPTTPGEARRFEDMSPEEQEAHLMTLADEADNLYARP
jgi:hypothetical protein